MSLARYLTAEEAAEILRVKPQTLRVWRRNGKGPRFSRPSHSVVLYSEEEIERFLSARTFGGAA